MWSRPVEHRHGRDIKVQASDLETVVRGVHYKWTTLGLSGLFGLKDIMCF